MPARGHRPSSRPTPSIPACRSSTCATRTARPRRSSPSTCASRRLDLDHKIATALFYGITAETQDLGREATPADIEAAHFLYPHTNKRRLAKIENARVPREYFRVFREAIDKAVLYGERVVVSVLGEVQYPDMVAEVADFLLRLDEVDWAAAIGTFEGCLHCSIRTTEREVNAGEILQRVLGSKLAGGHDQIAGGRIPVGTEPAARSRAAAVGARPAAGGARVSERGPPAGLSVLAAPARVGSVQASAASSSARTPGSARPARARSSAVARRASAEPSERPGGVPAHQRLGIGERRDERRTAAGLPLLPSATAALRSRPRRLVRGHGRAAEAGPEAGVVEREQSREMGREGRRRAGLRVRRGSRDRPPGRRRSRRPSSRARGGARRGWRSDARW